jgi:hypothetical protein
MGTLSGKALFKSPARRRGILAILIVIALLFSYFPERFRAASSLTPTDPSSLGLSGALGQLGALNTVFGSTAAVEVSLKVGQSVYTRNLVIKNLNLVERLGVADELEASRWLLKNVEIRSLRGGIVQIECVNRDPALATALVRNYTVALRDQLAEIALRQTNYKREILMKLVRSANDDLATAQTEYNNFRLTTRYSDPAFAINSIGERIPVLEATLKAKEVELNAARQFATDDNMSVRQIVAQIDALKRQLRQLQDVDPGQNNSIGLVVRQSTEAERLERELTLARSLYYNYRRFLEGTTVEDLTSAANIRVLEEPFIDTDRQYRLLPLAIALILLMLAIAMEFYWLRPPVSETRTEA